MMIISAKDRKSMAELIAAERARMTCTVSQAYIVLGPEKCAQIDAIAEDESQDWALRQTIKYATTWERGLPEIDALGALLGFTADEIDALFIQAMAVQ